MITYSYIKKNLELLNRKYVNAATLRDKNFYSKMAVLELCGWIEVSMDDIVTRTTNRLLKSESNKNYVISAVTKNSGFHYKDNFRKMMVNLVGISGCEKFEKKVNSAVALKFQIELGNLKKLRNEYAHTYTKGVTQNYDAPSMTIARYNDVADGLRAYEKVFKTLK